jgi:hypothetical protein
MTSRCLRFSILGDPDLKMCCQLLLFCVTLTLRCVVVKFLDDADLRMDPFYSFTSILDDAGLRVNSPITSLLNDLDRLEEGSLPKNVNIL